MTKGTKLSEFEEKKQITAEKRVEKFQRETHQDAVKPFTAITWKVQKRMRQENWLAGQKNYHHDSREELIVELKWKHRNIEISCWRCL